MAPYIVLRRGCGEGGAPPFSGYVVTGCGNVSQLHQGRFGLDISKISFTKKVVGKGRAS